MENAFVIMENDYPVSVVLGSREKAVAAMAKLSREHNKQDDSGLCVFYRIHTVPLYGEVGETYV